MDFIQIYGAVLIPVAFFNIVITLALKRTVECNRNDFNKILLLLCRKIRY